MAKHTATATVNAPLEQTYKFWSHFNDYPKFMTFVKEVTYVDDQRSHWVVDLLGHHEWDAVNEGWVPNESIGWRSIDGLENAGKVNFRSMGSDQTQIEVILNYDPPAGILGDAGEALGGGARVQEALEHDLNNFAKMVEQAGPGALDPESSNYLFHADSAAAKGETTQAQNQSMQAGSTTGSQAEFQRTVSGAQAGSGTREATGMSSTGMSSAGTSAGTSARTGGGAYTETGMGREDMMQPEGYGGEGAGMTGSSAADVSSTAPTMGGTSGLDSSTTGTGTTAGTGSYTSGQTYGERREPEMIDVDEEEEIVDIPVSGPGTSNS